MRMTRQSNDATTRLLSSTFAYIAYTHTAWSESVLWQLRVRPAGYPEEASALSRREARRRRLRVFVDGAGGESKELSVIGSNPGFHINKLPIRGSLELMAPDWDGRRK
jgi:hypothetical protein